MEVKVVNKQIINASVEDTLNSILDCEKWPTFIPTVKKIEILERNGNYAKRVLHSEINGVLAKMLTETNFIPEKNEIEYNQVKAPWPLVSNRGTWKVRQISNEQVELYISHIFKVKFWLLGYIFGLLIIGPFFIYKHNKKDLKLYKKYLENDV